MNTIYSNVLHFASFVGIPWDEIG